MGMLSYTCKITCILATFTLIRQTSWNMSPSRETKIIFIKTVLRVTEENKQSKHLHIQHTSSHEMLIYNGKLHMLAKNK